jgi:pyruvate ferredoxin oxidoreductase alpha subunit
MSNMTTRMGVEGSMAVALAAKLARVDVIAAYPITPQTHVIEYLAEFVANRELDAEYINVESEHSAISACVGASATGARTFTATSSQGLALMHEILYVASGCRLPIVMAVANRSLSSPISIWCDHGDTMAERDSGWIQIYTESCQEIFDSTLQAFKISENPSVLLPTMVCFDGFYLSHIVEPAFILGEKEVETFLPPFKPRYTLDPRKPLTMGPVGPPNYYFEFRRQQEEAMKVALKVIKDVCDEYEKLFGRRYGLVEKYRCEDAEVILMTIGSITGNARNAVDRLRAQGKKVGLVKVRVYRPFPKEELKASIEGAKVVAIIERAFAPGAYGGSLFNEVRAVMYGEKKKPMIINYVAGLGGRDVVVEDLVNMAEKALQISETGTVENSFEFYGVRE